MDLKTLMININLKKVGILNSTVSTKHLTIYSEESSVKNWKHHWILLSGIICSLMMITYMNRLKL